MIEWAVFLLLAAVAIAGALGMLLTMSMYRAAIFLMASFVALAGIFVVLEAGLLAAIQIMMNVGGMLVMILFMVPLMMDPGGEMMWDMKRKMHMPGLGALSMAMPRTEPPPEPETPHPDGSSQPASAPSDWTCPMHPEVSSPKPGKCPKCSMDLVARGEDGAEQPGSAGGQTPASKAPDSTGGHAPASRAPDSTGGHAPESRAPASTGDHASASRAPDSAEGHAPAAGYTCPMHPEVRSTRPGKCPKCGIELVAGAAPESEHAAHHRSTSGAESRVPAPPGQRTASGYTCPMHPEVTSERPGKCPRCGMELVAAEHHDQSAREPAASYTCPMHPEVTSETPGKCPKCGMDLVAATERRDGGDAPTAHADGAEHAGHDQSGAMDHGSGGMDHGSDAMDHGSGGMDHRSGGMDHGSGQMDHGSGAMDHGSGGMDHGSGGMDHGSGGMMKMSPRQHHKMMVDMAMSTELLPWAMAIGAATALVLAVVLARATWPLAVARPAEDAVVRVGELLLSRYMIAFEGAAYLILAGIVGAVVLGRRERERGGGTSTPPPASPEHGTSTPPPAAPEHGAPRTPPAAHEHGAPTSPPASHAHGTSTPPPAAHEHGAPTPPPASHAHGAPRTPSAAPEHGAHR